MTLTSEQLKVLTPPAGWNFGTRPTLRTKGILTKQTDPQHPLHRWVSFKKDYKALVDWALKNEIGLEPYDAGYYNFDYDERNVWHSFQVSANKVSLTKKYFGSYKCIRCSQDGGNTTVESGTLKCARGHKQKCGGCGNSGLLNYDVKRAAGGNIGLCGSCAPKCKKIGCSNRLFKREQGASASGYCIDCSPVFMCPTCNAWSDKKKSKIVHVADTDREVCVPCAERYSCQECGTYNPRKLTLDADGRKVCHSCKTTALDKERVPYEKFDKDELPIGGSLLVESLPSRPFRTVSIETEVDGDKDVLAGVLHRAGIVRTGEVEGYHVFPELDSHWAAFLKHDGSVSGGELISWCMNLDDRIQADSLLNTLAKLRSLHKIGKVAYNSNCGGHIHIDAHNFGIGDAWRLITGWNFLEDVIYRLAGAGATYGHRTLDPRHDRANGGGGYAGKPVKGPFGTKGQLHRSIAAQVRMSGLNFKPYFAALNNCRCTQGVGYDNDGRHCTCSLGKCTIEWRVWNSQANPRILHGWIAFMQALHAWADQGIEPDRVFEDQHPAHEYTGTKFSTCNVAFKSTSKERIRWIFKNLTFTDAEKDSLIYAFQQSELKEFDQAFWNEVRAIQPDAQFPVKSAPRNPAKRSCAIVVKPLGVGKTKPVENQGQVRANGLDEFIAAWQVQAQVPAGGF